MQTCDRVDRVYVRIERESVREEIILEIFETIHVRCSWGLVAAGRGLLAYEALSY